MQRYLRYLRYSIVAFAALCLVAVGVVWLMVTNIDRYRDTVEEELARALGHPVRIASVAASWDKFSPTLRLRDVRVYGTSLPSSDSSSSPGGPTLSAQPRPVVRFASAEVTIDAYRTFEAGEVKTRSIRVSGATITATHDGTGGVRLAGFSASDSESATTVVAAPKSAASAVTLGWAAFIPENIQFELLATNLLWLDPKRPHQPISFGQLNVQLTTTAQARTVEGWISFADLNEEPVQLTASLRGDLASDNWHGEAAMSGTLAELRGISALSKRLGHAIELPLTGAVSGDATVRFTAAGLTDARAKLTVSNFGVLADDAAQAPGPRLERVSTELTLVPVPNGWEIATERLQIGHGAKAWPTQAAVLRVTTSPDVTLLTFGADKLRLQDMLPWVLDHLDTAPRTALAEAAPLGTLEGLVAEVGIENNEVSAALVTAEVTGFGASPTEYTPGVSNVAGRLETSLESGRLDFAATNATLDIPFLYAKPRQVDDAEGTLRWSFDAKGGTVRIEGLKAKRGPIQATFAGDITFEPDGSNPRMDTELTLASARYQDVAPWMIVREVPASVRSWLNDALKRGQVDDLTLKLDGLIDDFPFDGPKGSFQVEANFSGATLDYAPGWPMATRLQGALAIDRSRLDIAIRSGEVQGAATSGFRVIGPNINDENRALELRGKFNGKTEQFLAYLTNSPLGQDIDDSLRALKVEGTGAIALDLAVAPLTGDIKRLAGSVSLQKNRIRLDDTFELVGATGQIPFDVNGVVSGKGSITGTFLGAPVTAGPVELLPSGQQRIALKGRATPSFLATLGQSTLSLNPKPIVASLSGETTWQATLTLPSPNAEPTEATTLAITSPLSGLGVKLPRPVGKSATSRVPLKVELDISSSSTRPVTVSMGENLRANGALRLAAATESWTLDRANLRLGGGTSTLPTQPGVTIDGRLREIAVDEWLDALEHFGSGPPSSTDEQAALRRISLDVKTLRFGDREFKVERIDLRREKDAWRAAFSGPDLGGRVEVPIRPRAPINVALDRLVLHAPTASRTPVGPRSTPPESISPVNVKIQQFHYEDIPLGSLAFRVTPNDAGLDISKIAIKTNAFSALGDGRWVRTTTPADTGRSTSKTTLSLAVRAPELGAFVETFGYDDTGIRGGQSEIELGLSWPGGPNNFDLGAVTGKIAIASRKGEFLELKPGLTGRAFGLLSLAALPRHLRLDFSHVFGEGFAYDNISGNFHVAQGNAYTNNLQMVGPSAEVELSGRTGLVSRDYDQAVKVTPRLTSSLPLAPIWLAEKVLQTDVVNQAFSSEYTLTGSWDDPTMTRLTRNTDNEPRPDTED